MPDLGRLISRAFLRKRRNVFLAEIDLSKLERTMGLFDLLCIGIGGTVGSGVFVLTGLIAREYAGPGVVISWLVAGIGCCFSAMSYAELSARIPSAGSSYAYVYVALGELPAVIAAWCLSLEYGISGAAVARSWGDKVNAYVSSNYGGDNTLGNDDTVETSKFGTWEPIHIQGGMNIVAGLLQVAVVIILLMGVEVGKFTVNAFTVAKMLLVLFLICAGAMLFDPVNLSPGWAPMGTGGILRGATSCFFGYIGYDEVCCMAAEAKDPHRTLPLAVFGTIAIVTVFYVLASFVLVGMQDYRSISRSSGFSEAFHYRGWEFAQQVVALGEIITLPLVVLVSFLAQPRLLYAMADDGLLPPVFKEVDNKGNLHKNIIICGIICTAIALFVPFAYLDDMTSAGVLVSFNLTNCSLVMMRRGEPGNPSPCALVLGVYTAICLTITVILAATPDSMAIVKYVLIPPLLVVLGFIARYLHQRFPENEDPDAQKEFRVPGMPYTPLLGILINFILLGQLSALGMALVCVYFGFACLFYFTYGINHSIGNTTGWRNMLHETHREVSSTGDIDSQYDEISSAHRGVVLSTGLDLDVSSSGDYGRSDGRVKESTYATSGTYAVIGEGSAAATGSNGKYIELKAVKKAAGSTGSGTGSGSGQKYASVGTAADAVGIINTDIPGNSGPVLRKIS